MEGIDMKEKNYGVKVFLFISREDDAPQAEYHKYRFAEAQSEKPDSDIGYDWRYSPRQKTLRVVVHKKCEYWLGKDAWRLIGAQGVLAEMIKAAPRKRETESSADKIFGSNGNLANALREFLKETICKIDLPDVKLLKDDDFKVPCTIFMHWGGGGESDYEIREDAIRKRLPGAKVGDGYGDNDKGWKFFSIGTERNELFNVDGNLIIIPETREELEALERKFERKNLIGKSNAELTRISGGGEINGEDIDNLGKVLKDERNRILHSNLRHDEKDKLLTAIASSVKYLDEAKAKKVEVKTEVPMEFVDLAAKILNKEVFHG